MVSVELVQILTIIVGLLTTALSVHLTLKFKKTRHLLGRALSWMLGGEAVAGLVTIVFGIADYMGVIPFWGEYTSSVLRWIIFTAVSGTSVYLWITIDKLLKNDN